jgi:hypothetical protein
MSKPLLGLLLGAGLGIVDGLSSQFTAANDEAVRRDALIIVSMGIFKGAVAGVGVGFFSRRYRSMALGIGFGLLLGVALVAPIAIMQGKYYWHIMAPGGLLGLVVGFATQRHGAAPGDREAHPGT